MTGAAGETAGGPEFPSQARLRILGDAVFLAMRSPHHQRMSVVNLRAALEPPIELGQFRIFRFDDIPRGMFTWAYLSPDAEARFVSGAPLRPEDWASGPRLWLIDLIAPYRGMAAGIARFVAKPGNFAEREFLFRRIRDGNVTRKILHIDFGRAAGKARFLSDADFRRSGD